MQSICQQSFKDYSVILVDDCGQDNSIALAEDVLKAGHVSYTVVRHERNRGLSAARNTGLAVAQEDYILFVDSDDQLMPKSLELLYEQAEATHADVTFGGFETFGDKERTHHPHGKPYVMAWNKLCRRRFLQDNQIAFIEGLIHEDCPWSFEVECKARRISVVPDITYRYLIRQGGLQTAGDYDRHFDAYCTILKSYAKTIEESIHAHRNTKSYYSEWFEVQKALYFSMTSHHGTAKQLREIYRLIRALRPHAGFSKAELHYYLPAPLGIILYRKFHKYHLC